MLRITAIMIKLISIRNLGLNLMDLSYTQCSRIRDSISNGTPNPSAFIITGGMKIKLKKEREESITIIRMIFLYIYNHNYL
jgi:hypothetical protein